MVVLFTEMGDTDRKTEQGAESREMKNFHPEKPVRPPSGDTMWAARCRSQEFRGEVKGGDRHLGVSEYRWQLNAISVSPDHLFRARASAASSMKPSLTAPYISFVFLSFPLS